MSTQRLIEPTETIVYHDGPQLFLAADQVSTQYLCLLVEVQEEKDRCLCVPVSLERLTRVQRGEIELRKAYTAPETGEVFFADVTDYQRNDIPLEPFPLRDLSDRWLPRPGAFLLPQRAVRADLVREAQARNRALIDLGLDPPEARFGPLMDTMGLANVLSAYENLIIWAGRQELARMSKDAREAIGGLDAFRTQTLALLPGSLTVRLQSRAQADMFGYVHIEKALRRVDEITCAVGDVDAAIAALREVTSNVARTYVKLLGLIAGLDMSVSYSWAIPEMTESASYSVRQDHAQEVYEVYHATEDIATETVTLVGRVRKVDVYNGSWTLESEDDGGRHDGRLSETGGATLSGLVVDAQAYRFFCEERTEQARGTGELQLALYLISYEALGTS